MGEWALLSENRHVRRACHSVALSRQCSPSALWVQNLHPNIMMDIREREYQSPTPIQAQGMPIALSGRDILGCAGELLPVLD